MFYLVFDEQDKEKMIANGCVLMGEQTIGGEKFYIFQGDKNINFESEGMEDIKYVKTNDLVF